MEDNTHYALSRCVLLWVTCVHYSKCSTVRLTQCQSLLPVSHGPVKGVNPEFNSGLLHSHGTMKLGWTRNQTGLPKRGRGKPCISVGLTQFNWGAKRVKMAERVRVWSDSEISALLAVGERICSSYESSAQPKRFFSTATQQMCDTTSNNKMSAVPPVPQ